MVAATTVSEVRRHSRGEVRMATPTSETYLWELPMVVAERFFQGLSSRGFHRVHYFERGPTDAEAVICVHGLTRNARLTESGGNP